MPVEYVQSGPEFTKDNRKIKPMAPIYICEGCGYRGAAFGTGSAEHSHHYCGWRDGKPVCIGIGRAVTDAPKS